MVVVVTFADPGEVLRLTFLMNVRISPITCLSCTINRTNLQKSDNGVPNAHRQK